MPRAEETPPLLANGTGGTQRSMVEIDQVAEGPSSPGGIGSDPDSLRQMVHDILQPLATIIGLSDSTFLPSDASEAVRIRLEQINSEARFARDICMAALVRRPWVPVRLDVLAASALESVRSTFRGQIALDADRAEMCGDPVALRRLIMNLLENSCRVAGPSGRVQVNVARSNSDVRLEVHDDATDPARARPGRAGVGLAVVDAVVADHRGYVSMAMSPLGGTCVRVLFPRGRTTRQVGSEEGHVRSPR